MQHISSLTDRWTLRWISNPVLAQALLGGPIIASLQVGAEGIWKERSQQGKPCPTDRRPVQGDLGAYISSRDYHSISVEARDCINYFPNTICTRRETEFCGEKNKSGCSCVRFPTCHVQKKIISFINSYDPIPCMSRLVTISKYGWNRSHAQVKLVSCFR
jgi:hypothetical protein